MFPATDGIVGDIEGGNDGRDPAAGIEIVDVDGILVVAPQAGALDRMADVPLGTEPGIG